MMFVKDGEGRGWLSQVWREASAGKERCLLSHPPAVREVLAVTGWGGRVSGWYQVMRKASG